MNWLEVGIRDDNETEEREVEEPAYLSFVAAEMILPSSGLGS